MINFSLDTNYPNFVSNFSMDLFVWNNLVKYSVFRVGIQECMNLYQSISLFINYRLIDLGTGIFVLVYVLINCVYCLTKIYGINGGISNLLQFTIEIGPM